MKDDQGKTGSIGLIGALSIGVGGIVGGGFFATFGITVAGAKGATPISFLLTGAIALVTAYSCVLSGLSSFLEDDQTLGAIRDKVRSELPSLFSLFRADASGGSSPTMLVKSTHSLAALPIRRDE